MRGKRRPTAIKLAIAGGTPAITLPTPCHPGWSAQQVDALQRAVLRGRYDLTWVSATTPGGPVRDFELAFEGWMRGGYALAVNSGASALEVALHAVGVGPGDEVAVAAYNWSQCASAIAVVGGAPRWVDVDAASATICPKSLRQVADSGVRAVLVTHLFGLPANMQEVLEIAQRNDMAIVEDCAQALPARYSGLRVGTLGDAAAFSLGARKHLCAGEGGVVYTKRRGVYERGVLYAQHPDRQAHDRHGALDSRFPCIALRSLRMHPLAAVAAAAALPELDRRCAAQASNHIWLRSQLAGLSLAQPPAVPPGRTHAWYTFPLSFTGRRCGITRTDYVAALRAEGVPVSPHYILHPLSNEPPFKAMPNSRAFLSEAYAWCESRGIFLQAGTAWHAVDFEYLRQLAEAFWKVDQLIMPDAVCQTDGGMETR